MQRRNWRISAPPRTVADTDSGRVHQTRSRAAARTGFVPLMETCLVVLRGKGGRTVDAPVYHPVIPDLWRVPDALARIRALLVAHPVGGEFGGSLLARTLPAFSSKPLQRLTSGGQL